ncbi:phage tail protein [Bacillus sp. Au-Bac7]|uniref:phage tail protein n=1 Tax=Bacillus sp. Au-Bac7 TaxID=2906458 RepID=UPI001E3FE5ED|nr:phage tail protein [Bacillus sp. Au-Bac7]MCE4048027.1 phage tail protein [Bacillus sp. Au-Bac7]
MPLTVDIDRTLLSNVQNRLGPFPNKAPDVITRALNRAMTNVAASISREVRQEYNIKASDVKNTLSKTRASKSRLSAIVTSRGQVIPIDRFKVSPKTVQPRRKKPIKMAVKKGSGLVAVKGPFVVNINGIKVFRREGEKRLPVKRVMGPSVPQMIGNQEVVNKINQSGYETFLSRMDYEINRALGRG